MGLQLIEFDPNDYKLSEVLASKDGEILSSSDQISAVFSLFFQWPEESKAIAYFDIPGKPSFQIHLEYDNEERNITQLFVKIPQSVTLKDINKTFIRLEVFNGCYEFESEILESFFEQEQQFIIISVPTSAKSIKVRRSPRLSLSEGIECHLHFNDNKMSAKIVSVTLTGVVLQGRHDAKKCHIEIEGKTIELEMRRHIESDTAFAAVFNNEEAITSYFEFYRKIAYPNLVPRKDVDYTNLYKLFEESGFFGNFGGKFDEPDRPTKAMECWKNLENAQHNQTIDCVAIGSNSDLIGSSSCALAFKRKNTEYWVFHQLCAKKDINSLDITGDLYTWRAEFLWMKLQQITSVFWFRSQSRWLERIYIKFSMQNKTGKVIPAQLYAYIHNTINIPSENNASTEIYGQEKRSYYQDEDTLGGLGPDYVHINRNMNLIYSESGNWESVFKAANLLTSSQNRDKAYFRIVMPAETSQPDVPHEYWEAQTVDRHAEIQKEGMLDFITCLKHSIAVTKKKHLKTG